MASAVARLWNVALRSAAAGAVAGRHLRRVTPRRAVGCVQWPFDQAPADEVRVWGWAWPGRDEVVSVHVTVDGRIVTTATLGLPPPDVARRRPETAGSRRCGWEAVVDLAPFARRRIRLGAIAVTERGVAQRLAGNPIAVLHGPLGRVETPAAGCQVTPGRLRVAGWALPDRRPVARVAVRVDGRDVGLARPYAAPRPDFAARRAEPGAVLAGFEHWIDVDRRPGQTMRLEVDVTDLDGRVGSLTPIDVTVIAGAPTGANSALDSAPAGVTPARRSPSEPAGATVRMAVFTHRLDLGGGQLYLQDLLRQLLTDQDVACLVVSEHDGPLRAELERLGAVVQVHEYPVRSAVAYERQLARIADLVRACGSNIVLANTMSAGIGPDVARRLGLPVIWAIHESYRLEDFWVAAYGDDGIAPAVRSSIRRALASTAAAVFEADATRAAYRGELDADRMITVPYGVAVATIDEFRAAQDRDEIRRALGLDPDATVLLCIGMFEPRKAQAVLALAFAEAAAAFPDAVLVLVGDTDNPYALGLRELAARLSLGPRLRLEPVARDPYRWYHAADAFVLASDVESMPRSLLEAMAFGLPVVAASAWGVPELVTDGVNGFLFPPRDLAAAYSGIRCLLSLPPEERSRVGRAGAALIRERHSVAGYADAYRKLVRGLLEEPRELPGVLLAR